MGFGVRLTCFWTVPRTTPSLSLASDNDGLSQVLPACIPLRCIPSWLQPTNPYPWFKGSDNHFFSLVQMPGPLDQQ